MLNNTVFVTHCQSLKQNNKLAPVDLLAETQLMIQVVNLTHNEKCIYSTGQN